MQWHGSTNKSPNYLNAMKNKFDTGDLFTNRETIEAKPDWVILSHHSQEFTIINHKQLQE